MFEVVGWVGPKMNMNTERILLKRTGGELSEISERILQHIDTKGDGTPEINPEIEEPLDILYRVDDIKREIKSPFNTTNNLKQENQLLGDFPSNIKEYIWIHSENLGDYLEDSRVLNGYDGKTYILAKLTNESYIYLIASMSGVLSEYYGTEDGDWQFGYLYVSKSREELIQKSMTNKEYTLYIKTTIGH